MERAGSGVHREAAAEAAGFDRFTWTSEDGLTLVAHDYRPPANSLGRKRRAATPVVCLPGLTRNARDFHAVAIHLSRDSEPCRRVFAVDFRGRGESDRGPGETYNPQREMRDLVQGLEAAGIGEAVFLGTSRGGIVAMLLALEAPERIRAAILNDIGPTIERAGLARIARYVGVPADVSSWAEAAALLREAQGAMYPELETADWERYARQLLRETGDGLEFDYDPALADAFRTFDPEGPLPDLWPAFKALSERPVLVIRGALSDILSAASVESMRRACPDLTVCLVHDQGHAPLLWDRFTHDAIQHFLASHAL